MVRGVDQLEDLDRNGRAILEFILKKENGY
jgi:hypothetical protein